MNWDDIKPVAKVTAAVGDNLETLSVAELERRIVEFEAEIVRVRAELQRKKAHEAAASALFKS
ncbi:MAG: DUF1192 domain-containing protein [Hyphomicrobium sp.]